MPLTPHPAPPGPKASKTTGLVKHEEGPPVEVPAAPANPVITDEWPGCACQGRAPQMLEHTPLSCSVLPAILLQAVDMGRPLTDVELAALDAAQARCRERGYLGPQMDAKLVTESTRNQRIEAGQDELPDEFSTPLGLGGQRTTAEPGGGHEPPGGGHEPPGVDMSRPDDHGIAKRLP